MVDLKGVVVRYILHPNTGKGIGCVVAVNTPEGIKTGWSQCNQHRVYNFDTGEFEQDTFSRKTARKIAIQRAISPPAEPIKPASVKFRVYRQIENPFAPPEFKTVVIKDPIKPMLEQVEGIAKRAFRPREVDPASKFEAQAAQIELPAEEIRYFRDADGGILGTVKDGVFEPLQGDYSDPTPEQEDAGFGFQDKE